MPRQKLQFPDVLVLDALAGVARSTTASESRNASMAGHGDVATLAALLSGRRPPDADVDVNETHAEVLAGNGERVFSLSSVLLRSGNAEVGAAAMARAGVRGCSAAWRV